MQRVKKIYGILYDLIYDIEEHDLKLQRSVTMLHHFLKQGL